ncbi:MAG: hypothetical protein ACK5PQ_03935 [Alphaproteobacteria bacterium]
MNRSSLLVLVCCIFNAFMALSSIVEVDKFRMIYGRISENPRLPTIGEKVKALGSVLKINSFPASFFKIFIQNNSSLEKDLDQAFFDFQLCLFKRKISIVNQNLAHFSMGGKAKALMSLLWIDTLRMPLDYVFAFPLFSNSFEKLKEGEKDEILKTAFTAYLDHLRELRQNQDSSDQQRRPFSLLSDLVRPCDDYTKILFHTLKSAQNFMIHRCPYVSSNKLGYVFPHGFIINPLSNSRIQSPGMLTDFETLFVVDETRHPLDIGVMYLQHYKQTPAVLYADSPFVPESQKGPLERETLRRSTLCLTLDSVFKISKQETGSFIPTTGAVYHQTMVFRSDCHSWHQYLSVPFQVGLIISEPYSTKESYPVAYKKDTKEKIRTQLDAALINNHIDIILSPFGCGDFFENDPLIVADLYKQVFLEPRFKNKFRSVIFSTLYMLPEVTSVFKDNIECLNGRFKRFLPEGFKTEWRAESHF